MGPLISVIVPVYNVEKYLCRCVDSLLEQTYRELEILLVNDGSTDHCGTICDEYAQKDARVRVIHKPNGGLADARNAALDVAQGRYFTFVDSDDWVSPDYVGNLYRALKKADADFSISCFVEIFEKDPTTPEPSHELKGFEVLSREECLKRMLYQDGIDVTTPTKLYKRELFDGLRYPVGKLHEDILIAYQILSRAEKVARIENLDYYYFQRADSIMNAEFNPRRMDGVELCHAMMECVKRDVPSLGRAAECRYFSTVCNILFQIRDEKHEEERKTLWKEVLRYRKNVATDREARKKARLAAFVSYGGYGLMRLAYDRTQWRGKKKEQKGT